MSVAAKAAAGAGRGSSVGAVGAGGCSVSSSGSGAKPNGLARLATRTYREYIWSLCYGLVTVAAVGLRLLQPLQLLSAGVDQCMAARGAARGSASRRPQPQRECQPNPDAPTPHTHLQAPLLVIAMLALGAYKSASDALNTFAAGRRKRG